MNQKGAYSGIIASIAIVAIIAIAFSSSAAVRAQAGNDYSKAIIDVKKNWQNARYLLDKSASDALADGSSCTAIVTNQVETYFDQTLNEATNLNCEKEGNVTISTTGAGGRDVDITVNIKCEKGTAPNLITYEKNTTFKKRVYIAAVPCDVDVEDIDSGICEVDPNGDGCS